MPHLEKVSYEKIFPLAPYINEKIGVSYLLNENDDPKVVLQAAKDLCEEFHRESKINSLAHQFEEVPDIKVEKTTAQSLEEQIMACQYLDGDDGLYSFKTISNMNQKLKEVFTTREEQLHKLNIQKQKNGTKNNRNSKGN